MMSSSFGWIVQFLLSIHCVNFLIQFYHFLQRISTTCYYNHDLLCFEPSMYLELHNQEPNLLVQDAVRVMNFHVECALKETQWVCSIIVSIHIATLQSSTASGLRSTPYMHRLDAIRFHFRYRITRWCSPVLSPQVPSQYVPVQQQQWP